MGMREEGGGAEGGGRAVGDGAGGDGGDAAEGRRGRGGERAGRRRDDHGGASRLEEEQSALLAQDRIGSDGRLGKKRRGGGGGACPREAGTDGAAASFPRASVAVRVSRVALAFVWRWTVRKIRV